MVPDEPCRYWFRWCTLQARLGVLCQSVTCCSRGLPHTDATTHTKMHTYCLHQYLNESALYIYIYIHILYIHTHIFIYTHIYIYIHIHIMHICIYIYIYTCVCVFAHAQSTCYASAVPLFLGWKHTFPTKSVKQAFGSALPWFSLVPGGESGEYVQAPLGSHW